LKNSATGVTYWSVHLTLFKETDHDTPYPLGFRQRHGAHRCGPRGRPYPRPAAPADIQLDQTGYLTNETKLAMVTNAAATGTFYLVNSSGPTTVLTGTLSAATADTDTGLSVRTADFSSVTATGNYYLYMAGLGQSYPFAIGPNVFSNAFYETIRF
jgi:hypothetical protein